MGIDFLDAITVHRWTSSGLLRLSNPGAGRRRHYPPEEIRAARALDSHRRLGGIEPSEQAIGNIGPYRRLQVAVANAARNNPPGAVVEIYSTVSWVRTIVVVPEP